MNLSEIINKILAEEKVDFQYTCINPENKEELEYIIDNAKEISYTTFLKNLSNSAKEFIKKINEKRGIPLYKDYTVSFYKSKLPSGKSVYYFVDSAIEYIFY